MVREIGLETTGASSIGCAQAAASAAMKYAARKLLVRFIVSAFGVHWVQGWRRDGCCALKNSVDRWQDSQGGESRNNQSTNYRAAERRRLRSALAKSNRHRQHAEDHRGGGHQDRAEPAGGAFLRSLQIAPAFMSGALGECDQQNGVRDSNPNRHNRSHERLHV